MALLKKRLKQNRLHQAVIIVVVSVCFACTTMKQSSYKYCRIDYKYFVRMAWEPDTLNKSKINFSDYPGRMREYINDTCYIETPMKENKDFNEKQILNADTFFVKSNKWAIRSNGQLYTCFNLNDFSKKVEYSYPQKRGKSDRIISVDYTPIDLVMWHGLTLYRYKKTISEAGNGEQIISYVLFHPTFGILRENNLYTIIEVFAIDVKNCAPAYDSLRSIKW